MTVPLTAATHFERPGEISFPLVPAEAGLAGCVLAAPQQVACDRTAETRRNQFGLVVASYTLARSVQRHGNDEICP